MRLKELSTKKLTKLLRKIQAELRRRANCPPPEGVKNFMEWHARRFRVSASFNGVLHKDELTPYEAAVRTVYGSYSGVGATKKEAKRNAVAAACRAYNEQPKSIAKYEEYYQFVGDFADVEVQVIGVEVYAAYLETDLVRVIGQGATPDEAQADCLDCALTDLKELASPLGVAESNLTLAAALGWGKQFEALGRNE